MNDLLRKLNTALEAEVKRLREDKAELVKHMDVMRCSLDNLPLEDWHGYGEAEYNKATELIEKHKEET